MGYSWGELAADGEVRVWPLRRVPRGDGGQAFDRDTHFTPARGPRGGSVIRRASDRPAAGAPPAAPEVDLMPYLRELEADTGHLKISGIVTRVQQALRLPIERLYTPLTARGTGVVPERDDNPLAAREEGGRVPLAALLPRHPRLLIEGQPGAGKTTFLRLVAAMLARDLLGVACPEGGTWRQRHLGLDPADPARVPVFLRLAALAALQQAPAASTLRRDNRHWLLDLVERSCADNGHPVPAAFWERLFERGEALLLLDGLDEVDDEALRARIFNVVADACRAWKCPVVVASRPIQTAELRAAGFVTAVVEPFDDPEIETFVDSWVRALHAAEEGAVEPAAGAWRLAGETAYGTALLAAILDRPNVRKLAANPVMLTCLCVVHWNAGTLPEGRSRVYREVLAWLLRQREEQRKAAGFDELFARQAFGRLALAMMRGKAGKRALVDLAEAVAIIDPVVARRFPSLGHEDRPHTARRWLLFEATGSGIIEELATSRLRFWHLTFQEYLAALELAWRGDGEKDAETDAWPVVREHLTDAQWRETVELLPGCLLDEGGPGRVDKLLQRIAGLRGDGTKLAAQARVAGVLGRILPTLAVLDYHPTAELQQGYEEALQRSEAIFTVEGAARVPFADRLAAAEALGAGGDPRLRPEVDNFLEVPGLGGVRLGKFPVTVEEYRRFVEEARGYEEPELWSREGWELRIKYGWESPGSWRRQLETPNSPVVEVSWYEAEAYCRWLSRQRRIIARLPGEAEWESAATAAKGTYPWGKAPPDDERANFAGNVRRPTPVGLYPRGDGPHGHSDLAGNVWEWCADPAEVKWAKGEAGRMLRGGGWSSDASYLRSAFCHGHPARRRDDRFGFRVAVSPPSVVS